MALDKQNVPLPFAGGVNTKVDALQLNPPFLASAQNTVFERVGRVQKRNGYAALSSQIAGTATEIDTGYALAQYRDELLAFDQNDAYSYAADANQWISKGAATSNVVTRTSVDAQSSTTDYNLDGATHPGGLQCYVWTEILDFDAGTFGVFMSIVDSSSGATVRGPELIADSCDSARVVVRGNSFIIYVINYSSNKIQFAALGVGTPLATISFTPITGSASDENSLRATNQAFDVIVADSTTGGANSVYLVFNNREASGGVSLWWFATGGATPIASLLVPAVKVNISGSGAGVDPRSVTVFMDTFRSGPVIGYASTTTVKMAGYSGNLSEQFYNETMQAGKFASSMTGVSASSTSTLLYLFFNVPLEEAVYTVGFSATYELSVLGLTMGMVWNYSTLSTPAPLLLGAELACKAWQRDGVPFLGVRHVSDLQSTLFVVDGSSGRVAARALRGISTAGVSGTNVLPSVTTVGADAYRFATGEILGLRSGDSAGASDIGLFTPTGVSAITIDFFDAARGYQWAEIGGNLHLGSGSMSIYDGQNFVEDGFHLSPEGLTVSGLSAGSTTSYSYVGVYEWTDSQNNLWRSSPSVAVVATSSAAISGANDAAIVFPTLRLTDKTPTNGRGNVMLALYRTEDGGSIYYRLPFTSTNINDTAVNSVTITDATEDADLVDGVRLYTDGGVVENVPPPPVGAIVAHRNRLFVLDSTNPLTIAYSKEVEPGIPAEFGEGFNIYVSPNGGNVTALASMDDKLVIFKQSRIFALTGEGPDPTGANDDYASPVFVTADCGCINPRSVVLTPDGLMFQSLKGIKLLTRALEVVDIGAPVRGLDTASVTSGVLMPDVDQVRFTFDDGTTLMFDYFVKQWAQFTNIRAVDSVIWNSLHVYLRSDGTSLKETPGVYTDNGSHIPMLVKTPWLKLAGLQGFQRLWRFLILGTYETAHDLLVSIAHDFNPTPSQVVTIEPTGPAAYGVDTPYGTGTPYGGEFPLYQWQVNMTRQTSQAVQITIQDVQSGSYGQGMTLSGLTLSVGVKKGTTKLGTANIVGP